MTFETFLDHAWTDHASHAARVAQGIRERVLQLTCENEMLAMIPLATHVYGEHLGAWSAGIQVLRSLRELSFFKSGSESDHAIARSVAALNLAGGLGTEVEGFDLSDQIRILTLSASALVGQGNIIQAQEFFEKALDLSQAGINATDPANRALAVAGNNLAIALAEKFSRTAGENAFMMLAAESARKFWEIAGGWLQVERAEYRLSQCARLAGFLGRAREHALSCQRICEANQAPALEFFFASEALCLVDKTSGNDEDLRKSAEKLRYYYGQLSAEDQASCADILQKAKV